MSLLKRFIAFIILFIILLGVPLLAKVLLANVDLFSLDPENVFLWFMLRHFLQAFIIFGILLIVSKIYKIDFKLGLGDKKIGLQFLKKFMIIFTIGCLVFYLISYFGSQLMPYDFEYNVRNIVGYLSFQLFFSGPSEELIFRAFSITMFTYFVTNKKIMRKVSYANIFAAIVFGLAHISINVFPFSISFVLPQIITSILLGYFYGDCYEKSKSVIFPMIMHSFSNVLMVGLTFILTGLL